MAAKDLVATDMRRSVNFGAEEKKGRASDAGLIC
jgi:hypothetical protein